MGMQVNTNVAANNAYRNLTTTQNELGKSLEKLSSGLRINRAADDAAGLAISEGLKSQVGGLTVASRNAQDAVSVIQTAEGSLNEVTSILQRMRDLAVQAGNDSNSTESRTAITTEVTALTDELTRLTSSMNFNGAPLLTGESMSFQIGANAEDQISVDMANVKTVTNALDGLDAAGAALTNKTTTGNAIASASVTGTVTIGQAGGKSVTVDFGAVNSARTNADVLATLKDQLGSDFEATTTATGVYTIASTNPAATGAVTVGAGTGVTTTNAVAGTVAVGGLDFTSAEGAARAISSIDAQITSVSSSRAELGANQNRFESVIKNLSVSKENLTAAGSRIRDTDMAEEMVKYTRANILSQAGTAMLAQANQSNSGVMQLLQ
jgi:flagellin